MKKLKQLLFILPILFLGLITTSCDDDDEGPEMTDQTIAQLASENDNLNSLSAALDAADLMATLNGNAIYTVFAPTDAAFSAFLDANNFESLDDVPVELLTDVLLNHVVSGEKKTADLSTGYETTLSDAGAGANALSLFVNTDGGVNLNGNSTVTTADVDASNGVIHIVDAVITSPSVVTHAVANPTFNALEAALSRDDLNADLVAALSGAGPFTFFAPTDAAFDNLYMMLGVSGLNDIDAETLEQVLTYHVISGANVRAGDIEAGEGPATLQSESFTFSLDNGAQITDASGAITNIIVTDVQGTNGIVHAIDRVLLPSTAIEEMEPSIVGIAAGDNQFSSLVAALTKADLVSTLEGDGPFTVFAPTNDAFSAFLSATGFSSLDDVPVDVLTQILLNHVVSGNNTAATLTEGYVSSLASGPKDDTNITLYVDLQSGVVINESSTVTQADVLARNGVIHVVDGVIGLPTVVTHAVSNPTFNILQEALTTPGLSANFVEILSGDGPFTVFAPTDDAFGDLLSALGAGGLSDIPVALLEEVLKYHVIAGSTVLAGDLTAGTAPATFEGTAFDISLDNGAQLIDATGAAKDIILTDVLGSNGVVHAINAVLLPESVYDAVNPSVVDIALSNDNFTVLVEALSRAGLVETLDQGGDFTVFAPTNDAFTAFLADNGFGALEDIPVDVLQEVLLNHVISGTNLAADLSTGYLNSLANSPEEDGNISMYFDVGSGVRINNQSQVVATDFRARNGVVHVVDAVIGLPNVVTFATSNPNFSILVQALTRTGLMTDFVAALSGDGPFTVFAPTDDAFVALLSELGVGSLNDIDNATLEAVLLYHVIGGANVRAEEITDDQTVNTLQNVSFTISTDSGVVITDNRNRTSNVVATNVQSANGVIHVIDTVLLP